MHDGGEKSGSNSRELMMDVTVYQIEKSGLLGSVRERLPSFFLTEPDR
jgi:hypothetical protein